MGVTKTARSLSPLEANLPWVSVKHCFPGIFSTMAGLFNKNLAILCSQFKAMLKKTVAIANLWWIVFASRRQESSPLATVRPAVTTCIKRILPVSSPPPPHGEDLSFLQPCRWFKFAASKIILKYLACILKLLPPLFQNGFNGHF